MVHTFTDDKINNYKDIDMLPRLRIDQSLEYSYCEFFCLINKCDCL